jgi:hypothetical protein
LIVLSTPLRQRYTLVSNPVGRPRLLGLSVSVGAIDTGRWGEPLTDQLLRPKVRTWRPSSRGTDLTDLELDGYFTRVPGYARPVWERWLVDPPDAPGAWTGLETRQRGAWIDLVRERGCRLKHQDRQAGHAYELDGRYITDEPGLYLALGEAFNGPGGYFG